MLAILISSPGIILLIHICLSRSLKKYPRQTVACCSAIIGYAPVAALLWAFVFHAGALRDNITTAMYAFIVYTGFAYFYFHLFNTSETARRIRLMYHIYRAGSLPEKEMSRLYDVHDVASLRLKRLVETGDIRLENGYYSIGKRLLYAAAVIVSVWQNVLGMPHSQRLKIDTSQKDEELR